MKKVFIFFLLFGFLSFANTPSIVFIHIGPEIPLYSKYALQQAHLFNPDCKIYFVCNAKATKPFEIPSYITCISCESLKRSDEHKKFLAKSTLDVSQRKGFWRAASERFFYLHELISQYNLQNVIHLENDVMLYVELKTILPTFEKLYPTLGGTFDHDLRCIPGIVYISNEKSLYKLIQYMAHHAKKGRNDMDTLSFFQREVGRDSIQNLPIIMKEYVEDHLALNQDIFAQHIQDFGSIFDAAALGQYLGGIDPRNGESKPGFINETCIFRPSFLKIEWIQDERGRKVPYASYHDGKKFRINNLHIHSKNLSKFLSIGEE
ncbi:MAG: hypothetical protein WCP39_03235 [Chlamydiota bacterium]